LVGVGALAVGGFVKMRSAADRAAERLSGLGAAGAIAGRGLQGVVTWAGRAGLAFAGMQVVSIVARQFQDDLNPQLDAAVLGLQRIANGVGTSDEATRLWGENLEAIKRDLDFVTNTGGVWENLERGFD